MNAEEAAKLAEQLKNPRASAIRHMYRNEREQKQAKREMQYGYPHSSPGSVYVAPIGTMWAKGAWEAVSNMVYETEQQGYNVSFEEQLDSNVTEPYAYTGAMRDRAAMKAHTRGFEWVCILDNDALPEPDLLVKLIQADLPVIGPRVVTMDGVLVGEPNWEVDGNVHPMRWIPLSLILMRTTIFNCIPKLFNPAELEGDVAYQLWHYGHRVYQHTGVTMKVANPPTLGYINHENWEKRVKAVDARRNAVPDRAPVLSSTPNVAGIALAWAKNGATPQ